MNITIEGNILVGGVVFNKEYQYDIELLGGFQIFLPIYEFLSTPKLIHMNIFEESLNFLGNFLKSGLKNRNNLVDNKSFHILGYFFQKYDQFLFTHEIKNKLIELVKIAITHDNEVLLLKQVLILLKIDVY